MNKLVAILAIIFATGCADMTPEGNLHACVNSTKKAFYNRITYQDCAINKEYLEKFSICYEIYKNSKSGGK